MSKEKKDKNLVMLSIGIALVAIGFVSPGLWPFQLPFCFIGGLLIGLA